MKCQKKGCKKKIDLIAFECNCKKKFCSKHRNNHNCDYNYKEEHKRKLQKENPLIKFKKIDII